MKLDAEVIKVLDAAETDEHSLRLMGQIDRAVLGVLALSKLIAVLERL